VFSVVPTMPRLRIGHCWSGGGTTPLLICDRSSECELVFVCEADVARRRLLRATFPRVPVLEDACGLDEHPSLVSQCHALVGEFPCSDCSLMGCMGGERAGLRGHRSGTVISFLGALGRLRARGCGVPGLLLFENVPGLLSLDGGAGMGFLRESAAEAGYLCGEWRVVDAGVWAAGLSRERVVIALWAWPLAFPGILLQGDFAYVPAKLPGLATFYLGDPRGGGMAGRVRALKTDGLLCYAFEGKVRGLSAEQRCALMGADYRRVSQYLSGREVLRLSGDGLERGMGRWMLDRVLASPGGFARVCATVCFHRTWQGGHASGWWDSSGFHYTGVGLSPVSPVSSCRWLERVLRGGMELDVGAVETYFLAQLGKRREGDPTCPEGEAVRQMLYRASGGAAPSEGEGVTLRLPVGRQGAMKSVVTTVVGVRHDMLFSFVLQWGGERQEVELLPRGVYVLRRDPRREVFSHWVLSRRGGVAAGGRRGGTTGEPLASGVRGGDRVGGGGEGLELLASVVPDGGPAVVEADDMPLATWVRGRARKRRHIPAHVSAQLAAGVVEFCREARHTHQRSRSMRACGGCLAEGVLQRVGGGKSLLRKHRLLLAARGAV
jgi:hypothetical protein